MSERPGPVLLYDGLCGFCNRVVRVILEADRRGVFRFASLGGAFANQLLSRHSALEGVDSIVLVEPGKEGSGEVIHVRSGAFIKVTEYLGGPWRLLAVCAVIPRPLRDWGYDAFARRRDRLFGRFDTCPVPPPAVRDRFLE